MVFAACQPESDSVEPAKSYELTVTSEKSMEFTAEGGNGEITYALVEQTRSEAPLKVAASCDAAWISEIEVAEKITFVVAANEGDARQTKIVVTYGDQALEVAVNQAAPAYDGVTFEAKMLVGEYYGEYYTPYAGNYYIFLTDNGFDENGYVLPNTTYYQLDMYGPLYEGEAVNGYIPLAAGTYYFDPNDTMSIFTIGKSYSCYMNSDSEKNVDKINFDAAELVVEEDGSCVLTVTVDGVNHVVTFSGESMINDRRSYNEGAEDVELEVSYAYGTYYGDQYNPGWADNFLFFLSDTGADEIGWELPNGRYYRFDLYSELIDTAEGVTIPYGTYVIDSNNTFEPWTIAASFSEYYIMDDSGWDYVESGSIYAGTVTIDAEGVVAKILVDDAWHTITYKGAVGPFDDQSIGDIDGKEGPFSTLTEDLVCNLSNHNLYYMNYGDYYEVGLQNWTFGIMPKTYEGDFVQFDVLASATSYTDFFGEYIISDSMDPYTSATGRFVYYDGYASMSGSWYYTNDGVTMAPFIEGTMSIEDNGDGTVTVEFSVYDDYYNNVSGSWTGKMLSANQMSTRAVDLKQSHKVELKSASVKKLVATKKSNSKF